MHLSIILYSTVIRRCTAYQLCSVESVIKAINKLTAFQAMLNVCVPKPYSIHSQTTRVNKTLTNFVHQY
jgi:hypothetical protein